MSKKFPLFISLENKNVLVVGAGNIAKRRIISLLDFDCNITVISDDFNPDIFKIDGINFIKRKYQNLDCLDFFIVLACTNDKKVNNQIYEECKHNNILVNICDCKDKCSFYFPSIIIKDDIVVGVSSSGKNHSLVKKVADKIRLFKNDLLK